MVAASIVSGLRRLLIEEGRWPAVREAAIARSALAGEWIDASLRDAWVPMERHVAIMQACADVLGDEGVRALGVARVHDSLKGGVLSPILRSWLRSYAGAPGQLLRVTPHVWSAVVRHAGRLELVEMGGRAARFRVQGAPEVLRAARAWHRFLEGYVVGVLEAGAYRGDARLDPDDHEAALDLRVTWA